MHETHNLFVRQLFVSSQLCLRINTDNLILHGKLIGCLQTWIPFQQAVLLHTPQPNTCKRNYGKESGRDQAVIN